MSTPENLPQPLTPADSNLRDFPFMPLDVVRLRDSDLAAKSRGDEFRCAVLLWCAAWHQTPAGSLPDDDAALANYAGFGRVVREWKKVKSGAMHGWVKCSDGRFYHPVVAEKVNEAWAGRVKYQEDKEADRKRKAEARRQREEQERLAKSGGIPAENAPLSAGKSKNSGGIPAENALTGTVDSGQGEGEGQLTGDSASTQPESRAPGDAADPSVPQPNQAALLSKAMRQHSVMANPSDPRLVALAEQGVTAETVAAACVEAKEAKPNERINPGYVIAILQSWARAAAKVKVEGAVAPAQRGAPQAKFNPVGFVNQHRTDTPVEVAP